MTCDNCNLTQVSHFVNPSKIYEDYPYMTSSSQFFVRDHVDLAQRIANEFRPGFALEIASNDGYMLDGLKKAGIQSIGIDPSKSSDIAIAKGHIVYKDFFTKKWAEENVKNRIDVIIANNVLAHVPELHDLMAGIKVALKLSGCAIIEIPDAQLIFDLGLFDTCYHEHFYYFTIPFLEHLCRQFSMHIAKVERIPHHGGSLRLFVRHGIRMETTDFKKAPDLTEKAQLIKKQFLEFIGDDKFAGFGAPAKGNTFLNFVGITKHQCEFVVDETPTKIGKLLPRSHIPILEIEELTRRKPKKILILPWNHKLEITAKLKKLITWPCEAFVAMPKLESVIKP